VAHTAQARAAFVPDVIKGDLDSARAEVLSFYQAHGALVIDAADDQARRRSSASAAAQLHPPVQLRLTPAPTCTHRVAQDTTDLQKCVAFALDAAAADPRLGPPPHRLAVLGALGGRLDHELAAMSLLHAYPRVCITLLGCDSAATLLQPGRHVIRPRPRLEGPICGLVPVGACRAATRASMCMP
jgi:thiamine pyrophosphokinase